VEFTIDELTALVLKHGHLAMLYRKTAAEHDQLVQVYLEAAKRINREEESKESKMNIRKIISGVLSLMLMLVLVGSLSVTRADDATPEATEAVSVVATVNGNPVEATLEPVDKTIQEGNQQINLVNVVGEKVVTIILVLAVVFLAYKSAGLVPKETFDSAIEKGFSLAKELAPPAGDAILDMVKPGLTKWLDDEFAKRNGVINVNVQPPTATSFMPPTINTDFKP